jgi:hypothetical protein
MRVNDLETSAHFRLVKVLEALQERHNIQLDFSAVDFDQLMSIYEDYGSKKNLIVESTTHNTYHNNSQYLEATLIQEAIHIFLSEVAPKRLNRRLKTTNGANNE